VRSARGSTRVNADASQPPGAGAAPVREVVAPVDVVVAALVVAVVDDDDVVVLAEECVGASPLQATSVSASRSATRFTA